MVKYSTPPRNSSEIPLVHKVIDLYKLIYTYSSKVQKRDRYGLYLKIENSCLDLMETLISSALTSDFEKVSYIEKSKLQSEVLKRLIRTANELSIVTDKKYILWQQNLQEISRMINGWRKYAEGKKASK